MMEGKQQYLLLWTTGIANVWDSVKNPRQGTELYICLCLSVVPRPLSLVSNLCLPVHAIRHPFILMYPLT